MCDTIIKTNIPKEETPQFVYKVAQKLPDGTYVSSVMGEPIMFGKWKTAPKRKASKYRGRELAKLLKRAFRMSRYGSSSEFEEIHNGKWAAFATYDGAKFSSLVTNCGYDDDKRRRFVEFPKVILKCQVGGEVHKSRWLGNATYLFSAMKAIAEV